MSYLPNSLMRVNETKSSAVAALPGENGPPQRDPEVAQLRSKSRENRLVWTCKCALEGSARGLEVSVALHVKGEELMQTAVVR